MCNVGLFYHDQVLVGIFVASCYLASGRSVVDRKLIIFANGLLEYKFRQHFEIPI